MCDPLDQTAIDAVREATGKEIIAAAASEHRILQGIVEHYGPADSYPVVPAEELLDLELAPSPVQAKHKSPSPDAMAPDLATSNPPAPLSIPEARVANPEPRFDIRAFLGTGRGIVIAAVAAVAFLALGKCTYDWITDKEIPVSGHFEADQVDLQMTLPATGWIYAPSRDDSESTGFVDVSLSVLYRGDSLKKPNELLALMRVKGPFPPTLSEQDFQQLIKGLNSGPSKQMSAGGFVVLGHQCAMSDRRADLTAECVGSAQYKGVEYDFNAFLWFERDSSVVAALFLTQGEFATFDSEIDSILQSIDIQ